MRSVIVFHWVTTSSIRLDLGSPTNIECCRDIRQNRMRWQSSENHDDITALQYHPSDDQILLSGGDDGLVGVFDTTIQDENDSLIQAFDHGVL